MKTLKDHTIIYDAECPLCNAYTGAFVKTGMLDEQGRTQYGPGIDQRWPSIDTVKARNEIALVNRTNNEVIYGIDSLFTILGHNLPVFRPLFRIRAFKTLMLQLYFFISYNRKVIAPGKQFENHSSCTPDMNYAYRWAYIVFAWCVTSIILLRYSRLMLPIIPETNFMREFLVCGGQVGFQGLLVLFIRRDRAIHYIGNMMTISLGGALLLLPAFLLDSLIQTPWFYIVYFVIVVTLMLLEHIRRTRILGLSLRMSEGWVFYRMLVLGWILG